MIVKTPGSQKGSPAAAEEGAEARGGRRGERGERRCVQARSTLESTAPKARSRSREGTSKQLPSEWQFGRSDLLNARGSYAVLPYGRHFAGTAYCHLVSTDRGHGKHGSSDQIGVRVFSIQN